MSCSEQTAHMQAALKLLRKYTPFLDKRKLHVVHYRREIRKDGDIASFQGHSHHHLQCANTAGEGLGDLVTCSAIR